MVRTPEAVRDPTYRHSPYIRALIPDTAIDIARVAALSLESEVAATNAKYESGKLRYEYAAAAALGPKRWLMDTGTPFDIVSVNDVNAEAEEHRQRAENNISLNAVGGIQDVNWVLPLTLKMSPKHKENITPLLIDSTSPAALSIGRRCMELGYGFYWPPRGKPKLVDPSGRNVPMEVHHFCPYIIDHSRVRSNSARRAAAPATSSSSSTGPLPDGYNENDDQTERVVEVPIKPKQITTVKPELVVNGDKGEKENPEEREQDEGHSEREPESMDSHLLDHSHKRKDCPTCQRVRVKQLQHGRALEPTRLKARQFGDHLTGDHLISLKDFDRGIDGETAGLVLVDVFTDDLACYGCIDKSGDTAFHHMNHYEGPFRKIRYFYSDASGELNKAARMLGWPGDKSTHGVKETNGIAENGVQRVTKGTACCLTNAGLEDKWWPYAAKAFCFNRRAKIVDGDSIYNKKFNAGHIEQKRLIPFGSRVDFLPTPDAKWTKDNKRKFGAPTVPGIFLGYVEKSGGRWNSKKPNYWCAPIADFINNVDHPTVMMTQVVIPDRTDDEYHFPLKEKYDAKRREVPPDVANNGASIAHPSADDVRSDENANGDGRPSEAIPLPDVDNVDSVSPGEVSSPVVSKPVEPTEQPAQSPEPRHEATAEQSADQPLPSPEVNAEGKTKKAVPTKIKPIGFRKAVKVIRALDAPNGNVVYYVSGGTVVDDEFTRTYAKSPRPPHITRANWDAAKNDKLKKWGWQREWNEMYPERAVTEITDELLRAPATAESHAGDGAASAGDGTVTGAVAGMPPASSGHATAAPATKPEEFPRMPTLKSKPKQVHRDKITDQYRTPLFSAGVARPVRKDEIKIKPKAQAAVDVEWAKLRAIGDRGCWDEKRVRSKRELLAEYRKSGKKCHWGRIFSLCVEKGSELAENDANRKYKGRVVFQGNNVKDENYDYALFADLGSSPCSMQAGKMVDAIGLMEGNEVQTSDAEAAYTQAKLRGIDTWVELPKDQWPDAWHKLPYDDPVCPLIYALYGHPDSGGYWEQHCDEHVKSVGFRPLHSEGWSSCYWHARLRCFLVVYVDDFKMAGPTEALPEAWKLLRNTGPNGTKGLKMDEPSRGNCRYLGCEHKYSRRPLPKHRNFLVEIIPKPPKAKSETAPGDGTVTGAEDQVPDQPLQANQKKKKFQLVDNDKSEKRSPPSKVNVVEWDQSEFLKQCVARYQELGGPRAEKLRRADTPYVDESKEFDPDGHAGYLAPHASKILMKILYAARMGRFDLLRATAFLACYVTKWTEEHDRRLHKLVCYINSTLHIKMYGWIGDPIEDLTLSVFSDADWAGEKSTFKSTTGAFTCLIGPNSFFPLSALSKKQTCVSHSTPEAEIVAADMAVKNEGLPLLTLWEILNNKPKHSMQGQFFEDNETGALIMTTGRNPTMRHIGRTHGICIAWLSERFKTFNLEERVPDFRMKVCPTDYMSADIFTKFFIKKDKWEHALRLIGHCDPKELWGSDSAPALWDTISGTSSSHDAEAVLARRMRRIKPTVRVKFWTKDLHDVKVISRNSMGSMRWQHVHAVVIQSNEGEVIDILSMPRDYTLRRPQSVKIICIHSDPKFSRNGKERSQLAPSLQTIVGNGGWQKYEEDAFDHYLSPGTATGTVTGAGAVPWDGVHSIASIAVGYQLTRGANDMHPFVAADREGRPCIASGPPGKYRYRTRNKAWCHYIRVSEFHQD